MYWSDLTRLIRRHAPDPASILFIKHDGTPADIRTIFDLRLARRKGQLYTGCAYEDILRDAIVCNVHYLNGEVPLKGWQGTDMEKDRPARGAINAIEILLKEGSIRPSTELSHFIGADSRSLCPVDTRLNYNEVAE